MFRHFSISILSLLFFFQSYSQILQPCATDIYNDQMMQADPSFAINLQNAENQVSAKGGQLSTQSTVVTIPVVVHIVYNTTTQNISDAQVQSQIDALNEDFRMLNPDTGNVPAAFKPLVADAQVEFCLAQRDPQGNPTTGITRTSTNETSFTVDNKIKNTSQGGIDIWDRNQYMNIWVGPLGGSLGGYAQFPGGSAATDGIVVNVIVFGRAPYVGGAYSKGRVTVHEVGHWLNLRHLWGSGSCGDDLVNDTPIHAGANYGCPTFPKVSSCSGGNANGELFMNHMDYTADACKVMFSAGQVARMTAVLNPGGLRYSLLSSLGCQAPTGNPVCDTPTNISVSNITSTSAQLSWIGAGANSYNLRIRETGTSTWTPGTSSGAVINATGLTAATQYDFEVQSECTGLSRAWSGVDNLTTTGGTCNTPTGLTATNITTTSAQLNWNPTGATSYNIQYRVNGTSTWTPTTSSATSVSINSLASGTQYDFQVQSNCNGTLSSWSSVANFTTTTATPICNTPTGLTATNITTTSAQLNWNSTGASS
ncbi:MAG: fibronectin type III domain-containing protein [Bacteroidia bacterium]